MEQQMRKVFLEECQSRGIKITADINGVFFGSPTGEQVYTLFRVGELICAWCGKVSDTRIQHKYHTLCYCDGFRKAHHEGD
jgi:hypothetical protein